MHEFCNGLAGGCAQCAENKEAATRAFETFCSICRQLHVWFSDGKGFAPDQIGEFTGIIIVLGLFSVSPAKLENIVECLLEIRGLTTVSRRMLGRGRGKTGHYSQAKYGMGSRKHLACNRWKRARKGLLHWETAGTKCRES